MIIALFGQPTSGKSTLADYIVDNKPPNFINIDGDYLRYLFKDKDYSREGRIKNLNRASDIAIYEHSNNHVVLSLIYPYKEARDYLNNLNDGVRWVYLTYDGGRERDSYHVEDFEIPGDDEDVIKLNTSELSIEECIAKIFYV